MKQQIVLLALVPIGLALEPSLGSEVDFAREVLPLLSEKCFVCHGPDGKDKEVLRLDSFAAASRDLGGYRAIDPDAPEDSEVLARIQSADDPMPPQEAEKQLTPGERELLASWIRQGGQYATHWSFIAPRKEPPADRDTATGSERVDAFIRARLQERRLDFASEADRATLARRAALVLTGLPPEPDQLASFLADDGPDAYGRYVDTLLASPRFGEHQARYWLDAVRYGDTHGLHLDNRRGIYPYRNWVIYALNKNMPLDDFIKWQLAGDLLPDPTLEQLVATGFVRMNPTTAEGGVIPAEFQAKNNFDRVETLGTVLLGMSLTCARCHSHKYDPVPQREYYRLLAFFNSTAEEPLDGNKYDYGPVIQAPSTVAAWYEWSKLESRRRELLAKAALHLQRPNGVDTAIATNWEKASVKDRLAMVADPQGPFRALDIHKQAIELAERIGAIEKTFTSTLVAQELPKPRTTRLLQRGAYDLPTGDPLEPGILAVMGEFPEGAPRNRLGLARWLTSRKHPLVSRVLVNGIWQRTFGEGLVRTPEDFGLQGQQPTHPKLLDWLAVELQDSGWDLKHMLRLLVHTRTFRQHPAWRDAAEDPENRLLARGPRYRLDAEVIRDVGLWASGLLDPTMGGEGVKPYQPDGLWSALMHPASNTKKYVRDEGNKLYRRSLYVYWKRTCPHPMLTVFDAPSREVSCVGRSRTSTPLQSLGLLNETQRLEMSRMLAQRLLHERKDDAQRLSLLFTLVTSREPTGVERAACAKLLAAMRERYSDAKDDAAALLSIGDAPRDEKLDVIDHAAWTQLAVTVLASDVAIMLY
jgi:hypothetical protein